jgi:hypothetical protein
LECKEGNTREGTEIRESRQPGISQNLLRGDSFLLQLAIVFKKKVNQFHAIAKDRHCAVIEIDIISGSLDKFPIYAQVGVPEIWRFDGTDLNIFRLVNGGYVALDESIAFPFITSEVLTDFVRKIETLRRTEWLRMLRAWINENIK